MFGNKHQDKSVLVEEKLILDTKPRTMPAWLTWLVVISEIIGFCLIVWIIFEHK